MGKASSDKIDIVIAWVDGGDKDWIKKKNKYSNECLDVEGKNSARFRDWNTLKYVLRSIEKNAPWVNRIYLVTDNQKPYWLKANTNNLVVVDHKDFIPSKYLPVFNANPIELNLHRINGLSEKFIYFNDDTVILNKIRPDYYFKNNLPCASAILNVHCAWKSRIIYNICFNDAGIINEHFDIKAVIKNSKPKWFNLKYGIKNNIQNIILSHCPRFPGFKQDHMPTPFLKKSFEELWNLEFEILDKTSSHKFRSKDDVNQYLIKEYQIVSNAFTPSSICKKGVMVDFEKDKNALKTLEKNLFNKRHLTMCINDGDSIENIDTIIDKVNTLLEKKYPDKSSYEI